MPNPDLPVLLLDQNDRTTVTAGGAWQVQVLAQPGILKKIKTLLARLPDQAALAWDLSGITALDHIGAQLLWNSWGKLRRAP